jgi:hypothetical protein
MKNKEVYILICPECGTPVLKNGNKFVCESFGCPMGNLKEEDCVREKMVMATYQED